MGKRKKKTKKITKPEKQNKLFSNRTFLYLCLFLIFVLFLFLRLRFVTSPILDFHWQRQLDTAQIARNFYDEGMNIFYPRVDWRGNTPGFVETNFPFYPYLVAILYHLFGVHEIIGRIVSILFAVGTFIYLYRLARKITDKNTALFAVTLFAFAPLGVYFTRTFQPESTYLFFATASLYHYYIFLESKVNKHAVLSGVFLALAALIKIPILLVLFFPFLTFGLQKRRLSMFKDFRIWLIAAAGAIPALLWLIHSGNLYSMTELSFSRWLMRRESFFNLSSFLRAEYWNIVLKQRFLQDITIIGVIFAGLGIILSAVKKEWRPIFWWNFGFFIFFFFFMRANYAHHYYQLIGLPAVSIAFSLPFGFALEKINPSSIYKIVVIFTLIVVLAATGTYFYYQISKNWYLRIDSIIPVRDVADNLQKITPPGTPVAVANDPSTGGVLYFSKRKGWRLSSIPTPNSIKDLKKKGAEYLCIVKYSENPRRDMETLKAISTQYKAVYNGEYSIIFDI